MLPVKQLGRILYRGMMTEEIHETHEVEDCPDDHAVKLGSDPVKEFYTIAPTSEVYMHYTDEAVNVAIHLAEQVPISHVTDIFTPPPNC